jgi:molybdopterin/thiamine biosynthesis adenylyltransferase
MHIDGPHIYNEEKDIPSNMKVVDAFTSAIREFFFVTNPTLRSGQPEAEAAFQAYAATNTTRPIWIYYPWRNVVVKTVPEGTYFILRTARNRNVITREEQIKYRAASVGVIGLSVGSAIVSALVMSGGPQQLKIADFDIVEITNLNRLRAKLIDVETEKVVVAAREVWELDPFAKIQTWEKGVTRDTLAEFLSGAPKLDMVIDEMDSLDLKVRLRFAAREAGIPVLMATDIGDRAILDIERYDLDPKLAIFNGRVPELETANLEKLTFPEWMGFAMKIVGEEAHDERMTASVSLVGKELAGVPQLGPTASVAGMSITYAIRKMTAGANVPSGRYFAGLNNAPF